MARSKRRARAGVMVPVASMGDIAFLLIAFFVLVSQFAKEVAVKMTPPKSDDIEELEQAPPITIAIDEDFTTWFDGKPIEDGELEALLNEAIQKMPEGERKVIVKADHELPYDKLEPLLETIAKQGDLKVALAGDEDKKSKKKPRRRDSE